MNNYIKGLSMDNSSIMPKYRQLMKAIVVGIDGGKIVGGDQLPSIHDLCAMLELSKNTVEKAYNHLKKLRVITSAHGKGFFITRQHAGEQMKVLLLFNQLNAHKKMIYESFTAALGERAVVDFVIYNNDVNLFNRLLLEKQEQYEKIVVIPHFSDKEGCPSEPLNAIPKEKLVLIDKLVEGVRGDFSAVYEDFESDIYTALEMLANRLADYSHLILVIPEHIYFSLEMTLGFKRFCQQYDFKVDIFHEVKDCTLQSGQAYIFLLEEHLVQFIEKVMDTEYKVGEDIGLISYNETPLKRVILDGITTISTDFELMGKLAAECLFDVESRKVAVPFDIKLRKSL